MHSLLLVLWKGNTKSRLDVSMSFSEQQIVDCSGESIAHEVQSSMHWLHDLYRYTETIWELVAMEEGQLFPSSDQMDVSSSTNGELVFFCLSVFIKMQSIEYYTTSFHLMPSSSFTATCESSQLLFIMCMTSCYPFQHSLRILSLPS